MSKLYSNEEGRVPLSMGEELTRFRRARLELDLPDTYAPAELYLLARPHLNTVLPLLLSINGVSCGALAPEPSGAYRWWQIDIDLELLRVGRNLVELWTEASAMNGWSLAMEPGHAASCSSISDDEGVNWRRERMGYLNSERGEYVVRMRLSEGEDPPPPNMIWEHTDNPRAADLRDILPTAIFERRSYLERAQIISSWLASSWEHTDSLRGAVYTPWDAQTIVAWGRTRQGHNGRRPVNMCVHFAVALVSACQVVGIPARAAVLTGAINGGNGHFVAEIFSPEHEKWIMLDPNCDAICWRDNIPLSIPEIQAEGNDLRGVIQYGQGTAFQRTFPHMAAFIRENLERGVCFKSRSIWPRADFLSRPELTPPGHGSLAYCETALVWEKHDLLRGFGMFSYFADTEYFDAAPSCA